MIKAKFGKDLDPFIHRVFPFLFKRAVNPNLLTVLGAFVSFAAGTAFALGHFFVGGLLILFGGLFDLVDGVVARHFGISTTFGAFLDSTLDRLVDMMLMLGIILYFASAGAMGVAVLAALTLVLTVLVSYAKARAERYVEDFEGGLMERGERVVVLALGGLTGLMVPALCIVAVGSLVTVTQRFSRAYREMARLDAERATNPGGD